MITVINASISLEQVATLLGHKSLDIGLVYTMPRHGDYDNAQQAENPTIATFVQTTPAILRPTWCSRSTAYLLSKQ